MAYRTRSWMFVPGNRQRFIDKAMDEVPVDVVILDLEDGVPPAEKPDARRLVNQSLRRDRARPRRFVRVNAVGSRWFDEDIQSLEASEFDGLCLPKVESPEEVVHALDQVGARQNEVGILAAIESARGLTNAAAIAASHEQMVGLMFGAEDFALDLGIGTRREGEAKDFVYARSAIVVAAASAHRISIDGVYPNLEDLAGLEAEVRQAKQLGFSGKSTFNPRQLDVINEMFNPSDDEIGFARQVVSAFESAQARGDGSVAVRGQLVDLPVVARARRMLELVGGET